MCCAVHTAAAAADWVLLLILVYGDTVYADTHAQCCRLAMLGVVAALTAEFATNKNVFQQVQAYPGTIAFTFLLWITATLVPILRGVPRKGNAVFTPGRELINGRIAMLGFVALIATEYFSGGQTIPHFYGLLK